MFELFQVTVFVSLFALVLAMPVALGIAIFLTQYAAAAGGRPLGYLVDLLAAVPSIIYGVWGLYVLAPVLKPVALWLNQHFGWFFLFATGNASVAGGGTIFTAGIVLGDDPADHHRGHRRGVRPDPARPDRGGPSRWGHPLGGGPGTTVLPFGMSGYVSGAISGWAGRSVRRSPC